MLAVDAGTSAIRCHVIAASGRQLAEERSPWPPSVAPRELPLAREFEPEAVLSAVLDLMRRAVGRAGAEVAAVAVTSMRQAVAFLDGGGRCLYLGPNVDLRAVFEGAAMDAARADAIYRTTGHLPSLFLAPARLAWMRANRPGLFERISTAVTLPDWLIMELTGRLASEPTLAGEAGLLDVASGSWAVDLAAELGIPMDGSVPIVGAGTPVGGLSRGAARRAGMMPGTPVTSAGADTQCAALGMGATEPGQAAIVAGWSAPVQQVTAAPSPSEGRATWFGCHLEPGRWVAESSAGDAGRAYSWISETTGRPFDELESGAEAAGAGAEGTVAVLGHPAMDMSAVGVRGGGWVFPVPITMNERGPGHLARAGLESAAFSIRASLERLEGVTGQPPRSVALGGGMARSGLFRRIVANVIGADILVCGHGSATAAGAFACAMSALGDRRTPATGGGGAGELIRVSPDRLSSAEYRDHYERWLEVSSALARVPI